MTKEFIWLLCNTCQVDTHKYTYRIIGKYDDEMYSVVQRKSLGSDEPWEDIRKIYPDRF